MPYCRNCGNTARFVLSVELSLRVFAEDALRYDGPDWTLELQCDACASHDVVP